MQADLVIIKGAGELASGVGACLHSVGFRVLMTEISMPLAIRRTVCFSEAIYDGQATVEGIVARRADSADDIHTILGRDEIAVLVDPEAKIRTQIAPLAVIDAIMAKKNLGTHITDAPIVIALGPGFVAGRDAHAVIETNRGHHLGRIIWEGTAQPDTGIPAPVEGRASERVLRAPADGIIRWHNAIGDLVQAGQCLGELAGSPIVAPFTGVLRGAIRDGIPVTAGMKIGDVDPRQERSTCFTISDKARAVAGGTLQALLMLMRRLQL